MQAVNRVVASGGDSVLAAVRTRPALLRHLRALASLPMGNSANGGDVVTAQAQLAVRALRDAASRESLQAAGAGASLQSTSTAGNTVRGPSVDGHALVRSTSAGSSSQRAGPRDWDPNCAWHSYFVDGVQVPSEVMGDGDHRQPRPLRSAQFAGFPKRDDDPRRGDTGLPGRRTEDVVFVADAPVPSDVASGLYYFEVALVDVEHSSRDGPSVCVGLWSDTASSRGMYVFLWLPLWLTVHRTN